MISLCLFASVSAELLCLHTITLKIVWGCLRPLGTINSVCKTQDLQTLALEYELSFKIFCPPPRKFHSYTSSWLRDKGCWIWIGQGIGVSALCKGAPARLSLHPSRRPIKTKAHCNHWVANALLGKLLKLTKHLVVHNKKFIKLSPLYEFSCRD